MNKIWQKNKQVKMNKVVEKFLTGDDTEIDLKLFEFDIQCSLVHINVLLDAGVLVKQEHKDIKDGLEKILKKFKTGQIEITVGDEDVHTVIENQLHEEIGVLAGKLQTMRSRNDQIATDIKLYIKDNLEKLLKMTIETQSQFNKLINEYGNLPMPGYTHMQLAMPSSIGLWLKSFLVSFDDDLAVLLNAKKVNDVSPLGSAAGYGGPISINTKLAAKQLGFAQAFQNSLYCQNSRGKMEICILHGLYQLMMTINKFACDCLIFSMKEFDFMELPEGFLTGSSMMANKQNYDVFELLKSKTGMVGGYLNQIMLISMNLNSGYNRNFQDLKQPLIKSFEITLESTRVLQEIILNIKFNESELKKAMLSELYITEKVYKEIESGLTFREAYKKYK